MSLVPPPRLRCVSVLCGINQHEGGESKNFRGSPSRGGIQAVARGCLAPHSLEYLAPEVHTLLNTVQRRCWTRMRATAAINPNTFQYPSLWEL